MPKLEIFRLEDRRAVHFEVVNERSEHIAFFRKEADAKKFLACDAMQTSLIALVEMIDRSRSEGVLTYDKGSHADMMVKSAVMAIKLSGWK